MSDTTTPRRRNGRTKRNLPPLPPRGQRAFARKPQILGAIPIAESAWDREVRAGRFPQPIKIGGCNLWRADDIHDLIDRAERGELVDIKGRVTRRTE